MDNDEINLAEVFGRLLNNIVIILLSAMIGAMAAYCISTNFISEKFQSGTSIYVLNNSQEEETVTYTDMQTGSLLTKDYAELIKSRTVMSNVIAELDLKNKYNDMSGITPDGLAGMITVTTSNETRVLQITVTDTDPARAQDIANAVRVAASRQIYDVMDIDAVNVVDYANLPETPVSPNTKKNIVIGGLLGFLLAVAGVVIVYLLDDTIKNPDDVEKYLELSVLASIPYDEKLYENNSRKQKKGRKKACRK
ncbi:MAG: YveK family protein [Lachnospiraceae bacterium]